MSIRIAATLTPEWQRANARAIANAAAGRRAERIAERTYRITSAHGSEPYTVTVNSIVNLDATCSCAHGQNGSKGVCWHKSAAIAAAIQRCAEKSADMLFNSANTEISDMAADVAAAARRAEVQSLMGRFSRQ